MEWGLTRFQYISFHRFAVDDPSPFWILLRKCLGMLCSEMEVLPDHLIFGCSIINPPFSGTVASFQETSLKPPYSTALLTASPRVIPPVTLSLSEAADASSRAQRRTSAWQSESENFWLIFVHADSIFNMKIPMKPWEFQDPNVG